MSDTDGVRAAVELGRRKFRVSPPRDPDVGAPRTIDGVDVFPGQWSPVDFTGLPPDCPVEPLGYEGDVIYLMDVLGQLSGVAPSTMGQKFVQRLFGNRQNYLYWAWPRVDKKGAVTSWRAEKVAECLYHACAVRGLFSPSNKVRGRGAWRDRHGHLVYHSGGALWRGNKRRTLWERGDPTGFVDGQFYPRRPDIFEPWPDPVTKETQDHPAVVLIDALRSWNWERPRVDPVLMFGTICASILGGALPWRPTSFLIGDKATGKSSLQALVKAVLGDALVQAADTSAAGIYQHVGMDSLGVAVDELESEADNRKQMAVIKLARLAASGALMLRGGQDHAGVEFRAQSTFVFSSINPPPLQPQDVSRMAMLRLKKLDPEARRPVPTIDAETTGPKLLRRLIDEFGRFDECFAAYREVLAAGGHDGRGQDTLGVLLACADLALGPDLAAALKIPMTPDTMEDWAELLATRTMLEYEDAAENWSKCLKHLLTSRVEAWRGGQRQTIGQLLADLDVEFGSREQDALGLRKANEMLAQAGVKVLPPGEIDDDLAHGWGLAVPNESQLVAQQFRDTQWAGVPGASVWKSALRQGPAEVICVDPRVNRVRINGVQERCTLVRLRLFHERGG